MEKTEIDNHGVELKNTAKTYRSPKLVIFGRVRELTTGGSGSGENFMHGMYEPPHKGHP